jgi:cell division protein FtsQ
MKLKWTYIRLVVLLGLIGFLMSFSQQRNQSRKITDLDIKFIDDNSPFITLTTVNKLLIQNNDSITSIAKETLVLKEMESRILHNPMVRKAQVFVTIDGTLGAQIEQRNPIARVAGSANFYLDEDGKKMPLSVVYSARVPLITGSSKQDFAELTPLVKAIRNDSFMNQMVTGLHVKNNGDVVLTMRKIKFRVLYGKPEQMERKFENFKAFFQKLNKDDKLTAYSLVDLRFGNQVVATKI